MSMTDLEQLNRVLVTRANNANLAVLAWTVLRLSEFIPSLG